MQFWSTFPPLSHLSFCAAHRHATTARSHWFGASSAHCSVPTQRGGPCRPCACCAPRASTPTCCAPPRAAPAARSRRCARCWTGSSSPSPRRARCRVRSRGTRTSARGSGCAPRAPRSRAASPSAQCLSWRPPSPPPRRPPAARRSRRSAAASCSRGAGTSGCGASGSSSSLARAMAAASR